MKKYLYKNSKVLVSFSGGVDSSVLLDMLVKKRKKYNLTIFAFHLNHMLRDNAKRDEDFVKEICKKHSIPLFSYRVDVLKESKINKRSFELEARITRKRLIDKIIKNNNIDYVYLAHHLNDSIETFFMNLLRGTGRVGVTGIKDKDNKIIRPLIKTTKKQIVKYAVENNVRYVVDETNEDDIYFRNDIRNNLIPLLEKYNENYVLHISNFIDIMNYESLLLDDYSEKLYDFNKEKYSILKLRGYKEEYLKFFVYNFIKKFIGQKDIKNKYYNNLLSFIKKSDSGSIKIKNNIISIESGYLYLNKKEKKPFSYKLVEGDNKIDNLIINLKVGGYEEEYNKISIPVDKVKGNLVIRSRIFGDLVKLKGLNGTKKLKDFFIDEKIPKHKRNEVKLLADDLKIYWVLNYRKCEVEAGKLYYIVSVYNI